MRKIKQIWSAVRHGLTILGMPLRRFIRQPMGQALLIVAVCCVLASVIIVKFIRGIPTYHMTSVPGTTLGVSSAMVSTSDSANPVSAEAAQSSNESAVSEDVSSRRGASASSHAYSRRASSAAESDAPHLITPPVPASPGRETSIQSSGLPGPASSDDNGINSSAVERPSLNSSQKTDLISSQPSLKSELSSSPRGVSSVTEP